MELKPTLKDFTASEFKALVERIWAVDLPRLDHNHLINHFDRIVGHPKGADLLFAPDETGMEHDPDTVVHHVRQWHREQGLAAFKDDGGSLPPPPVRMTAVQHSLTNVRKIALDVAVSEQAVDLAFSVFGQRVQHFRSVQGVSLDIYDQENNIRELERAQHDSYLSTRKFEFFKMHIEFTRKIAQGDLKYARSDLAQWQDIAHQINGTYDRYIARLAAINQRHRTLHDEAEALMIAAQQKLIGSQTLAGASPALTVCRLQALLAIVGNRPNLLLEDESSALEFSQQVDLQKAIRSAVAEFTWRNTSDEPADEKHRAAVLQFEFTSRADNKVFGLSVPLFELMPVEGQDWQSLAAERSEVLVPVRMGSAVVPAKPGSMFRGLREVQSLEQVHITSSRHNLSAPRVRVRGAQSAEQPNSFSFTADGSAPITIEWSASTAVQTRVPDAPPPTHRVGFVYSSSIPPLELVTGSGEDVPIDDYIVVFPSETGLEPLYVVFGNRHE
ncbi:colicin immunity protein [Pseudomonas sp. PB120]|uniref:bacteriocin immunity protein n=1 Tax=Pseudomonas sp. PB120 TaxID=2494700 RepID=UPI0012FE4453|nr:bacteriocin immunity protein [Pseudomonas sp. PB120]MVV49855.1 colicin immunity protein [Pseudomonas sp. PB120]